MIILGLETSQIPGTIALCRDDICLEERNLQPERRHAETLLPEIGRLLSDHGFGARDCNAIMVSQGPGSFTGLRIGVTCAKTLAYAIGAQIAAVPTLLAVAQNAPANLLQQSVISDAQRKQMFLGEFSRGDDGSWQQNGQITIVDASSWAAERTAGESVSGPALLKHETLFQGRCQILPPECWIPNATAIAQLGAQQIRDGKMADQWSLQPFYLRKSAAEENLLGNSLNQKP